MASSLTRAAGLPSHKARPQQALLTCHTASSHCRKTGDDSVGESECARRPNMWPNEHHSFSTKISKPSKVR